MGHKLPYLAAGIGEMQAGRLVATLYGNPSQSNPTSIIAVLAAPGIPQVAHGWITWRGSFGGNGRAY